MYCVSIQDRLVRLALVASLALCTCSVALAQTDEPASGVARGHNGMVATAHPLASQAALQMLQAGGNAVDAAVAAAFAIGVVEPDGSGIGGGGGMVIYLRQSNRPIYINYYTQSSEDVGRIKYDFSDDRHSAEAALIPGNVAGLTLALEKYGTLPLAQVLAPAIAYAEEGFPIDATLAQLILDNVDMLQIDSATAAVYLDAGFPKMEGDRLVQKDLANTLRVIAEQGRDGFYRGPLAEAMVKRVTELGGALTLNDLTSYQAELTTPLEGTYRGYTIYAANMPQSGEAVLQALNMFEQENLGALGHYSTSAKSLHLMAETFRRVYADRWQYLGDPKFTHVPIQGLISKAFAEERFRDINVYKCEPREYRRTAAGNPDRYDQAGADRPATSKSTPTKTKGWGDKEDEAATDDDDWGESLFDSWGGSKSKPSPVPTKGKDEDDEEGEKPAPADSQYDDPEPERELDGSTTHVSVIDKDGNMVALTQTLGTFFGSGVTVDGVLLNCGMSNFSQSCSVNLIAPRKQPRSSISPMVLLKNGRPFMVVGSPGAGRITCAVAEVIANVIDFGMDVAAANDAARFFCQKYDDYLYLEGGIAPEVGAELERMGHTLRWYSGRDLFFGGVQIILVDPVTGEYQGSSDPRRGGVALGF